MADQAGNTNYSTNTIVVKDTTAPVITSQPVNLTNNVGSTAVFNVAATSCSSVAYQWLKGTNVLVGKTNSNLTLPSVTQTNAGTYSVLVSSVGGTNLSAVAILTVASPLQAPVIVSEQILGSGNFQVVFQAPSGQTYSVLGSVDASQSLASWSVLTNGTFGTNNASYTDPTTLAHPQRFYIIKSP